MTPQAIYPHIRKMLEVGFVEIAKEERIEHFIETYYQATAEIFHFTYGDTNDPKYQEAYYKDLLGVLTKIGLTPKLDEDTIINYAKIHARKKEIYACCKPEIAEKISEMEDLDFFTKQEAIELASGLSMSDVQFEELLDLEREARMILKTN
jgi:hypothetical protein